MSGFVGVRAKRKKRNVVIILISSIIFILFYYIIPSFQLEETLPPSALLPNSNDTISPIIKLTIEELEFEVLDREQKIVFRNNEIKKLKEDLRILFNENDKLSNLVVDLKNKQNSASLLKKKVENFDKQLAKTKKDNEAKKNDLLKKNEKIISENELLKKEYKIIDNKNIQLKNLNNLLEKKIREEVDTINKLNILIQELKDNYHRR